jgi:hypothetical protein
MVWKMSSRLVTFFMAAATVLAVIQGCAAPHRLAAVPVGLQDRAEQPGLAGVRYRVGCHVGVRATQFTDAY